MNQGQKESLLEEEPAQLKKPATGLKTFGILLLAYLMLRLPWTFMLPMSEAPDEFAHFWVIRYLKEHFCLPSAADVQAGGASAVYGSLPQLGYIPHVLFAMFSPDSQLVTVCRFGSIAMGALMVFAAYKIGKILFANNALLALALPLSVIVHPQLVFIHAYSNNDSTSSALASLIIWLSLETVQSGIRFKRLLAIGALSGWLAITKYSGLAVLPAAGICIIASCFLQEASIAHALMSIGAAALLAALISLPWFWHNNQIYPGDFLGTKTMYKSWATTFNRKLDYYLPASHIIKDHRWWRMTFFSYFALFGYMTKYLWRPVYWVFGGMVSAAVLGWLNGLRIAKIKKPDGRTIIIWSSLALVYVLNITAMIWASTKNLGGPQGRYLITSEIPIMALLIGGLNSWGENYGKKLVVAFLSFNLIVTVASFIYLFQLYGGWHLNQTF